MNSGALAGGSGRRRHAVGLSLKICSALQPIWRARRAAYIRPLPTPRCIPTGGASLGQTIRLRGSGRARVRAMAAEDPSRTDLLTVGLLVFFLSLIVIVAALLVLPSIL